MNTPFVITSVPNNVAMCATT